MINPTIIFVTALLIEVITLFGRFIIKISSKEVLIKIMKFLNIKIVINPHHGIIGLLIAIVSFFYDCPVLFNLGLGLFISDIFHHFIVLWAIVGNPEFHVVYKNLKYFKKEQKADDKKIKRAIRHLIYSVEK